LKGGDRFDAAHSRHMHAADNDVDTDWIVAQQDNGLLDIFGFKNIESQNVQNVTGAGLTFHMMSILWSDHKHFPTSAMGDDFSPEYHKYNNS